MPLNSDGGQHPDQDQQAEGVQDGAQRARDAQRTDEHGVPEPLNDEALDRDHHHDGQQSRQRRAGVRRTAREVFNRVVDQAVHPRFY